ncbi:10031_t:CDS:1, partial [Racocetra persica]
VPYPTDKFEPRYQNKNKEILKQRPPHSIRKDIQRTLQDLLAKVNPTNNLKLGATFKLLDASVQT